MVKEFHITPEDIAKGTDFIHYYPNRAFHDPEPPHRSPYDNMFPKRLANIATTPINDEMPDGLIRWIEGAKKAFEAKYATSPEEWLGAQH